MDNYLKKADYTRIILISIFFIYCTLMLSCREVFINWQSFFSILISAVFMILVSVFYKYRNANDIDWRIYRLSLVTAQIIIFSNLAVIGNYFGFCYHHDLQDQLASNIDRYLGLDWFSYVIWLKSNFFLSYITRAVYDSAGIQIFVIYLLLAMISPAIHFERFVVSCMIAASITIAVWTFYPTFGALPLLYSQGLSPPPFDLSMSKSYAVELIRLHASNSVLIDSNNTLGLIGFPSFHTVIAVMSIYGVKNIPVFRMIITAVNIVALLAIPADGGHHFVDVIGGAVVGAISIGLASVIL